MTRYRFAVAAGAALLAAAMPAATPAFAGAPFMTDDPDMPDPGQLEINLSFQYSHHRGESGGALPGVEANYVPTAGVQLHLFQALAFDRTGGGTKFGPGDTELGVKYRFWDERDDSWLPAAAIFPLLTLPTGDEERGLGTGHARVFLPLWLGKSFGDWSAFGGGGYFVNPGADRKNYVFAGAGLLRKVSDSLSLGAEIFHASADMRDGVDATGFNFGGSYNFTENQALLLSVGRGLRHADEANRFSTYIAYHVVF